MTVRVRDIERAIAHVFPVERAEEWDRVGLLVGDPNAAVKGVALALDPTVEAVRQAVERGANVLVTHHPAYLSPLGRLTPGGASGVVFEALSTGVALINAHTNLDRHQSAQSIAVERLGLEALRPLETTPQPRAVITVYVPVDALEAVRAAMIAAGAGRVGDYEECSFSGSGSGSFLAPTDGHPLAGAAGERSDVDERRLEMVCPRSAVSAVVTAAASVHPYEEPLITASDVVISPNSAALGMLATVPQAAHMTLSMLAAIAARSFGVRPRVWGDPERRITRVATATGSAGSLVGTARAAGADVLLAGEVRYHDALSARSSGLCVIEVGHDASEWPLVGLLEDAVRAIPELDPDSIVMLSGTPGWWVADIDEGA